MKILLFYFFFCFLIYYICMYIDTISNLSKTNLQFSERLLEFQFISEEK